MRPRGERPSSPVNRYVGQWGRQRPQATQLARPASPGASDGMGHAGDAPSRRPMKRAPSGSSLASGAPPSSVSTGERRRGRPCGRWSHALGRAAIVPPVERDLMSLKAASFTESVIREMTRLAAVHDAVNLGQGFPDFPAPDEVKEAARRAIAEDRNQYPITWGSKELRD